MSAELTKDMNEGDIPGTIAMFLNGELPLFLVKEYFSEIEGNDIGDFDVRLADGRLFRAYFEEVSEDEDVAQDEGE